MIIAAPSSPTGSSSLHFQQHKFALPSSLGKGSSYLRNDLRPVLKKASICSRDLPLVSGTQQPVNKMFPALMTAKNRKGTSRPKAFCKVGQKTAVSWCREGLRRGHPPGSTHHGWEEELGQGEGCQPAHNHTEARGHPTGFEREDLRHQQPSDGAPAHGVTCRGGGEGSQALKATEECRRALYNPALQPQQSLSPPFVSFLKVTSDAIFSAFPGTSAFLPTPNPISSLRVTLPRMSNTLPWLVASPVLSAPTHDEEHGCQEGDEGDVVCRLSREVGRAHQGRVGHGAIVRNWHEVGVDPHGQVGDQHDTSCGERHSGNDG